MAKIVYGAREGSQLSEEDAQTYGERLKQLEEKKGYITPNLVLQDAKKASSPLHDYFEWDNSRAAEAYRLKQAGELIRCITVTIINDGEQQKVRRYYSVKSDPVLELEEPKMYVPLETICTDVDKKEEVIRYALRELKGWRERYAIYQELGPLVKYIDEFIEKRKR